MLAEGLSFSAIQHKTANHRSDEHSLERALLGWRYRWAEHLSSRIRFRNRSECNDFDCRDLTNDGQVCGRLRGGIDVLAVYILES